MHMHTVYSFSYLIDFMIDMIMISVLYMQLESVYFKRNRANGRSSEGKKLRMCDSIET